MLDRPERVTERFPLVQDPPFRLENTHAFLFLIPADGAHLDAMLDRTFGWAAPDIKIRKLAPLCLIAFTDVGKATASDPMLGSFAYKEATIFVPVWGERNGAPFFGLHVPFIYPDQGLAVAAGREVYGLPKKPGSLVIPSETDFWSGTSALSLRALSAQTFDGSPWTDHDLLTIRSTNQTAVDQLESELLSAIDTLLGPLPAPLSGLSGLLKQDLIAMKQVADVTTGGLPPRVLYRAVTRVKAPLDSITTPRLGDASKVTLELGDIASEPIRNVLGLPAQVTPLLAASLTMTFGFQPGEVWKEQPDSGVAPTRKTKVLILGGGMSALTTAHALTDTEERRNKYDIRVLAQGHYLGGKGASTRNPAMGQRSEEHGLHVLFGFYHNALKLLRSVYTEAARPTSVFPQTFDEAFRPTWSVAFDNGEDEYTVTFPRMPAGFGAGPLTLEEQLKAVESLAGSALGGPLSSVISSALFPSLGNKVLREIVAFVATLLKGVFDDVVVRRKTFDELDGQDFREWMLSHKIPLLPPLGSSAIMQVPYDGVFAYEGPDQSKPRLSAGIAARGLLKLVADYEVAPYFEMAAGMGECVFAPMYEVLKARGVSFELFSKVKDVHVDGGRVTQITYAHQAEVLAGPYAYNPQVTIGSVTCWNHTPDLTQLASPCPIAGLDPFSDAVDAEVTPELTLAVDTDFDWIVCGLPAPVTAKVLSGHAGYPDLAKISLIRTVATLHLQTWYNDPIPSVGWTYKADVLGGFPQPLNSMHKRDQFLGIEQWPPPQIPKGLLYASGPFGGGWSTNSFDPAARATAAGAANSEARAFVNDELWKALPVAEAPTVPPTFDTSVLFAPMTPADPIADQYIRNNIDLSARYTFIEPGGLANRPGAVPQGVSNLRLVGDWTHNGVDIPCIEGTVVSALKAAESILGVDLGIFG